MARDGAFGISGALEHPQCPPYGAVGDQATSRPYRVLHRYHASPSLRLIDAVALTFRVAHGDVAPRTAR